jgi:hypothetical protein
MTLTQGRQKSPVSGLVRLARAIWKQPEFTEIVGVAGFPAGQAT